MANHTAIKQWNGELPDQFGNSSAIVGTFSQAPPSYFIRSVNTYSKSNAVSEAPINAFKI